jgi:isopentenyldiphosphate isomerase
MAERIDIFNANLESLGSMDRLEAHLEGQWHQTFHCWVVSGEGGGKLLFQVRSAEVENFPNELDVSAAGHLEAGEIPIDGVREVSEELGIQIDNDNLYKLGYRVEVADQKNGQRNREYQLVYLYRHDAPLSSYSPQVEEVAGLLWVGIQDALALFSGEKAAVQGEGIEYDRRLCSWVPKERLLAVNDFLPRIQNYYLTAAIMGDRMLKLQFPLAIS